MQVIPQSLYEQKRTTETQTLTPAENQTKAIEARSENQRKQQNLNEFEQTPYRFWSNASARWSPSNVDIELTQRSTSRRPDF